MSFPPHFIGAAIATELSAIRAAMRITVVFLGGRVF
jgi:hypothetical protein